ARAWSGGGGLCQLLRTGPRGRAWHPARGDGGELPALGRGWDSGGALLETGVPRIGDARDHAGCTRPRSRICPLHRRGWLESRDSRGGTAVEVLAIACRCSEGQRGGVRVSAAV